MVPYTKCHGLKCMCVDTDPWYREPSMIKGASQVPNIPRVVFAKMSNGDLTPKGAKIFFGDVDVSSYVSGITIDMHESSDQEPGRAAFRPSVTLHCKLVDIETEVRDDTTTGRSPKRSK